MGPSPVILWASNIPRPLLLISNLYISALPHHSSGSILEQSDLGILPGRLGTLVPFTLIDSLRYSQREYQPQTFAQDVEIFGEDY